MEQELFIVLAIAIGLTVGILVGLTAVERLGR